MKPMKRHMVVPIVFLLLSFIMMMRIVSFFLRGNDNNHLAIAWGLLSILFLFLFISYFTTNFLKRWFRWIGIIACCVMVIIGIVELFCGQQ